LGGVRMQRAGCRRPQIILNCTRRWGKGSVTVPPVVWLMLMVTHGSRMLARLSGPI